MNPSRPAITLLALAAVAVAQKPADLVRLRDEKRAAPFLKHASWTTSLAEAKAQAQREGKMVLAYFTRSYAPSPPSERLEQGPFMTPGFEELGEKVVLYCHITSRVKSDPDQDLPERLGGQSFPFLVAMDAQGRPIAIFDRDWTLPSLEAFVEKRVLTWSALAARAKKGDKKAKAEYLVRRIRLGHLRPKEIETALEKADYLSKPQRAAIVQGLTNLQIVEILKTMDQKDPKSLAQAAERLVAMKSAGRVPTGRYAPVFWQVVLGYADTNEQPKLFEEALRTIENLPGARPPESWLRRMNLRLRALRFMKGREKQKGKGG